MNSRFSETPLWDAVRRYVEAGAYPYHIPGHKQGRGLAQAFAADMARYDLTELPGLDNLLAPAGPLAESEALAAEFFGTAACHYTTGGSTSGVIASLMATCPADKRPLVPRNAHVSCVYACVLADLVPVFYDVKTDSQRRLFLDADVADFGRKLSPQIGAALLVSPNYHGVLSDVDAMVAACRAAGVPLVVDEAHGTHLLLSPPLPASAVLRGADVVVQSAHKTGVALTGSSWVHVGNPAYAGPVKAALRLIQSTSPSYLQLVSLDLARAFLAGEGHQRLPAALAAAAAVRETAAVYTPADVPGLDPLRLPLDAIPLGLSGHELGRHLQAHGVAVEMTDATTAVLVLSPADDESAALPLRAALAALAGRPRQEPDRSSPVSQVVSGDNFAVSPRSAYLGVGEEVDLSGAAGRITADPVTIYPPGSPLIWPGQRIEKDFIEYINMSLAHGASATGLRNGRVRVVK